MQKLNDFLLWLDQYIGGHQWFVYFLLGTGLFFTLYLGFPQFRYFKHAIRIIKGKFDKKEDVGDTSHFQALTTALSGTIGTGNIAGVALAIHLGGPAALFWMLVTALFGMTLKFVEVSISHKYRDILPDGSVSGGPMYYMKKKLNIKTRSGKVLKTGAWLGGFFAFATILSSFGTGNLPQINSISDSIFDTFGLNKIITGAILAVLLGAVIIGGIKRIAKVTSTLVPAMAIIYILGALFVITTNYENIIPSFVAIFRDAFSGSAAVGGFLGAGFAFTFNRGVNRGLFSNEAGQGSAPIAHSAAKAEPVSEGMVALLGPFIDTIIICTITGLVLLSSGVWNEKIYNKFEDADLEILTGKYSDKNPEHVEILSAYNFKKDTLLLYTGPVNVKDGKLQDELTFFHAGSIAEDFEFSKKNKAFTGSFNVLRGKIVRDEPLNSDGSRKSLFSHLNHENNNDDIVIWGKSLIHSAPLTTEAFKRSFLGDFGQYIVSIGLLLFAFSTAISWSYYGDRAVTYLFGSRWVMVYRLIYVVAFFFAAFTDTTIVWNFSLITIAIMTVPNLFGILILHKDLRKTIHEYWITIKENFPDAKVPRRYR